MLCLGLVLAMVIVCTALAVPLRGPVVSNTMDQVYPSISGSVIVWQDYRNVTPQTANLTGCPTAQNCVKADIFARDLITGTETQLTFAQEALDPDISGDLVAWRNWDTGKIVVHNLTNRTDQNASNTAIGTEQQVSPAISGNRVVWIDYRNPNPGNQIGQYGDIYMRDLSQLSDEAISLGSSLIGAPDYKKDKKNPDFDGNIIVWEDWRNATTDATGWIRNPDIYMRDLTTGTDQPLCTNPSDQYNPVVSGHRVFWQDYRNGNWDIYMKDLSTGIESRVTSNNYDQVWPNVSGDLLTWKDTRSGYEDIYTKNLTTGVETALTFDSASQKAPVASGTSVAWMDRRAGNWDIYEADDVVPPVIGSPGPGGWNNGSTVLTATYSDTGKGIDTASVVVKLDSKPVAGCTVSTTRVDCPVSGLADGAHVASFNVKDLGNNPAVAASASFSVDNTGPALTSTAPSGWLTAAPTTITATYADTGRGVDATTVSVVLDGIPAAGCTAAATSVSCPVSGIGDGHHAFTVNLNDLMGNPAVEWLTAFDVDSTGPLLGPLNIITATGSDSVSFSAALSDAGIGVDLSSVHTYLDGTPPPDCSLGTDPVSCTAGGLNLGPHSISISATDKLGNSSTVSGSFAIVDNIKPFISNTSPTGSLATAATTIGADFSDVAPSSGVDAGSVKVMLDGTPVASCTASSTSVACPVSNLSNGNHLLSVQVSDNAGNSATSDWSFMVASTGPIIANMKPSPGELVNNGWPSISADFADNGRGVDAASAHMYLDGVEMAPIATATHISETLNSATVARLVNGTHTVRVTIADNQGETAVQSWSFTVTSPSLQLSAAGAYWPSYAAYLRHELTVDYRMTNSGTGSCNKAQVSMGTATSGVLVIGPIPVDMGNIAPGAPFDYSLVYLVPAGVGKFYTVTYADCSDGGGDIFWFAGPPPLQ